MKKLFSLLVLLAVAASLSGQRLAKPNRPSNDLNPLRGYVNITELTGGPGLSVTDVPYSKYYFGLTTVNGYQINKYVIAGIGVGIQSYNEGYLVPFYVSGRFTYPLENSKISPYVNGDVGILLNFKDSDGGTWTFFNPLIGARYTFKSTMALDFGVGVLSQMQPDAGRDSFLNFKLGLVFIPKR
jgi:hypothetical protein